MTDDRKELERRVLERIVPSPETVRSIEERASRLKDLVESYVAEHGIDVEARFAGSFSKNTFLSDPDLDLFLLFPTDVPPEDLKRIGLKAGEDILHGERMFSDHPYTRGRFEGLEVDMVPCYRIDSTDHLKSAVDRTPFHTAFIKESLTPEGCDQVRLLKKFMKAIGTYGAEQDSRGFSGYLCELMIVRFGSFDSVLEAATRWNPGTVLGIRAMGPKMKAPLVFYDPVDSRRNAASAVHADTMARFIAASKAYIEDPREEFFFPKRRIPLGRGELSGMMASRGTRLVSVSFPRPEAIEDNLQSQLWKTQYALAKKLDDFGFGALRAVHSMTETELTVVFELESDRLSAVHRHRGPPVWVESKPFLDKWNGNPYGGPYIEDACWNVMAERQFRDAAPMLEHEAGMAGIGRDLDPGRMKILGHEETLTTVDQLLLTELLDPKFPWDRER